MAGILGIKHAKDRGYATKPYWVATLVPAAIAGLTIVALAAFGAFAGSSISATADSSTGQPSAAAPSSAYPTVSPDGKFAYAPAGVPADTTTPCPVAVPSEATLATLNQAQAITVATADVQMINAALNTRNMSCMHAAMPGVSLPYAAMDPTGKTGVVITNMTANVTIGSTNTWTIKFNAQPTTGPQRPYSDSSEPIDGNGWMFSLWNVNGTWCFAG
ncbi:hypothetical protein HJC99_03655 [Candidatus Saccharibacteria bacterium]|nr:hypothetical protein [Candidatus Saccharibacteria bacterium]